MTALADSSAVALGSTVLAQHQAALTLLQGRLSAPNGSKAQWLDLACGRGQIVSFLQANLSPTARKRLSYWGVDIDQRYAREAQRVATTLELDKVDFQIGAIAKFTQLYPAAQQFDFITFTNTVHEVSPAELATVLVDAILRLSDDGTLFVYDMEVLPEPELGAVPWRREEAEAIIWEVVRALGAEDYQPEVGRWHHRSCTAWNAQVHRQYLGVGRAQASTIRDNAIQQVSVRIDSLLKAKLVRCTASLEALTQSGAATPAEELDRTRLLYEHWAVDRALRGVK